MAVDMYTELYNWQGGAVFLYQLKDTILSNSNNFILFLNWIIVNYKNIYILIDDSAK